MEETVYRDLSNGMCIGVWPLDDGETVSVIDISVYNIDGDLIDHKLAILNKCCVIMMPEMNFAFTVIRYGEKRLNGLKLLLYDDHDTVPDGTEISVTVVSQSMEAFVLQ